MKQIYFLFSLFSVSLVSQAQSIVNLRQKASQRAANRHSSARIAAPCPATPKDEDFQAFTNTEYPSSLFVDCLEFGITGDGGIGIDDKNHALVPTPAFNGNILLFLDSGSGTGNIAHIKSVTQTINFRLSALSAEFFGHSNGNSAEVYSIVGFDDGVEVVRVDGFDVTQGGTYGNSTSQIVFTHEEYNTDGSNSGRLVFGTGWNNIDEFRFIATDEPEFNFLFVGLDDIDFEPAGTGSLPVTLTKFTARKENMLAQLSWQTSAETRSDRFEIQHSTDGKTWNRLADITAAGESTRQQTYQFTHSNPAQGDNYYRLKMIDSDNVYTLSKVEHVGFDFAFSITAYPNPAAETIHLTTGDWAKVANVQVVNSQGEIVYSSGKNPVQRVNARSLAAGLYFIKISFKNGSEASQKVVIGPKM